MSRFWDRTFRVFYWLVARLGPLLRPVVERFELGNIVELIVPGRRTGRPRVVLLGLLRVDNGWYLGHPNGSANWTRNLDAAGLAGSAAGPAGTAAGSTSLANASAGPAGTAAGPAGPAAGSTGPAMLRFPGKPPFDISAELLPIGDERRQVIQATWRQHVFPGPILYWFARRHIFEVGRYYRIELVT